MTKLSTEESLVLDVPEAGRLLNLSRATTYSLVHQGSIPSIRLGKRLVIPKAALMKMLSETSNKNMGAEAATGDCVDIYKPSHCSPATHTTQR